MTDHPDDSERTEVLTLQDLIRARREERGWSYADLEKRADSVIGRTRWQQLGSGIRLKEFPAAATLEAMAHALEVDVTTIVLAAARSIGLDARMSGPALAHLLPAGTDRLSPAMHEAILTLIRAAVADVLKQDETHGDRQDFSPELTTPLGWRKSPTSHRRNSTG